MYYTPSPIGFSNPTSVLTVQDEGSRHNLSGILSQLPDLTSTQIVKQPQQQQQTTAAAALYYHHFSTASTAAAASSVAIQSGRVFDLPGPFQGHQIFQKQLFSYMLFQFPSQNKKGSVQILITRKKKFKSNTYTTPNMKQITHGTTHNKKGHIKKKLKITPNMDINQPIFRLKSMG